MREGANLEKGDTDQVSHVVYVCMKGIARGVRVVLKFGHSLVAAYDRVLQRVCITGIISSREAEVGELDERVRGERVREGVCC